MIDMLFSFLFSPVPICCSVSECRTMMTSFYPFIIDDENPQFCDELDLLFHSVVFKCQNEMHKQTKGFSTLRACLWLLLCCSGLDSGVLFCFFHIYFVKLYVINKASGNIKPVIVDCTICNVYDPLLA